MAMVSGRRCVLLAAALVAPGLMSGCAALMPVNGNVNEAGHGAVAGKGRQQAAARAGDAPLPRQAYNSAGEKVPYVAQPNPYTADLPALPPGARPIFVVASGLLKEGKLKSAEAQFRKLDERFPSLSGPWVKLGQIAERRERFAEAIEDYKKAIDVNKRNVNAYIALALVQRRQGLFSDAETTYLDALDIWRDFPEAHLNLAILYDLYMNEGEEAQKHYEAYDFLTGGKDEKVHKWLVEIKRRTGIEHSFIDIPPKEIAVVPPGKAGEARPPAGT
jgi:tetratricopeptide (TPR) repeat protein